MNKISRREAMESMTLGGLALSAASPFTAAAQTPPAQTPAPAPAQAAPAENMIKAFAGQHKPKPLPFDPAKLNGLSEKLIRSHWENNYGGTVRALNAVELRLAALMKDKDLPPYIYGGVKREELLRTGSLVLHDLYFANLGGDGKAGDSVLFALRQTWETYEQWEAEFKRTGNALAGGAGWVVLGYNQHTGELHNYWAADHMHNATFSQPLLVLDMYEHAYHMDYGAAAARYVDAFMVNVKWEEVNRRFMAAKRAATALLI